MPRLLPTLALFADLARRALSAEPLDDSRDDVAEGLRPVVPRVVRDALRERVEARCEPERHEHAAAPLAGAGDGERLRFVIDVRRLGGDWRASVELDGDTCAAFTRPTRNHAIYEAQSEALVHVDGLMRSGGPRVMGIDFSITGEGG